MDNTDLIQALKNKRDQVMMKYQRLNKRNNPRIPHKLNWIINSTKKEKTPKGFAPLNYLIDSKHNSLDQLARTFCALEEFETWIEKVEEGNKRHQVEMEKQADTKICRFKTFAALSDQIE